MFIIIFFIVLLCILILFFMRDIVLSFIIGMDGIKEEIYDSINCVELVLVLSNKEMESVSCKEESMDICFFDFIIFFGIFEVKVSIFIKI